MTDSKMQEKADDEPISFSDAEEMLSSSRVADWNRLRAENPNWRPVLIGAMLNGATLDGADLSDAMLDNAQMHRASLRGTNLSRACLASARLTEAQLQGSHLCKATLWRADLEKANLDGVEAADAAFGRVEACATTFRDASLTRANFTQAVLLEADMTDADLSYAVFCEAGLQRSKLAKTDLTEADLSKAILYSSDLTNARLYGVNARDAQFQGANLSGAILIKANLRRANLEHAVIGGVSLQGARLIDVRGLHGSARATAGDVPVSESQVRAAIYSRDGDFLPWTWLKSIGSLRLFGVSYLSMILIVMYARMAHWYNTSFAVRIRAEAQRKIDEGIDWPWREFLARIPDLPVPAHLGRQLIFIVILALAATIYQMCCPSVVKETTETVWSRQLNHSLIEYRSAMFSRIVARYATAILFLFGGGYTIFYLGTHTIRAMRYLLLGT